MTIPIIPIETIKQQAHAAAERGEPIGVCPYDKDSPAGKWWCSSYWEREIQLSGEQSA